ncbi:hypothetical protein F0562_006022 [Nyssa sinensis]|uniref:Uncharacterized protein n=1 Tax=Nyssa sinensis TaxID=561372 RepID=A0A5J5AJV3_9ASTE|nr:hypothetical protein F0562_006022 [Nyssa sinensis]
MESFHGDSLSPSIRGRRSLINGSHGGRGGGESSVRVAHGILTNKHSFCLAICGKEGLSLQDQNGDFPLGNSETHKGDGRPTLENQKDLKGGNKRLSPIAVRGSMGRVNPMDFGVENRANPLGKSWSQVVKPNVQQKGFTLEYVAPCVKEDKVVVQTPPEVLNEGTKLWATTLVGYFLDQKLNYQWVNNVALRQFLYGLDSMTSP